MAVISQEDIKKIRSKADIVEVIKEYIPLSPQGKNYFGICPFHEDHSPSMSVSKEKQLYKCFSCGASGNVFTFLQNYLNISFIEAVEMLASKVGESISVTTEYKKKREFDNEYQIMKLASLFYQNNLHTKEGEEARRYLLERNIDEKAIEDFGIGLSLNDGLLTPLLEKKKIDLSLASSLGLLNFDKKYYDLFRSRIMFPIHNLDGDVVGFTGRIYHGEKNTSKYMNTKETVIFKKGEILFNYHRAKNEIRLLKQVILVEGNMDALRMYENGFKNTVALMGTAMTSKQVNILKHLRVPIVLMFDNDEAGALATLTNGKMLREAKCDVSVVRLTGEKDPDEYILKHGVDAMASNIKQAGSFIDFLYLYYKDNKNLNDSKELAKYINNILDSLNDEDDITKDIILQRLVKDYNLSLDVLKSRLEDTNETVVSIPVEEKKKVKKSRLVNCIEHILYYMMNSKEYIDMYRSSLGVFKNSVYRSIANEIIYYGERNQVSLADFLIYAEESPLKNEIFEIINNVNESILDKRVLEDYIYTVKELMWEEEKKELKAKQKETMDINMKEKIGSQIVELTKKIQEIKVERSGLK